MYVLIDGIRYEVKKDVQVVFEDIFPQGGPEPVDLRIWAEGNKDVLIDVIGDDQILMSCKKPVDDFYDDCVRNTHEIKRVDTVNVIEICGEDGPNQMFSFENDKKGREKAKSAFLDLLKENKCEADQTPDQVYLEDGKYDDGNGYQILMVTST